MNERPLAGLDVSKRFSDLRVLAPDKTVICETKIFHDLTNMIRAVEIFQTVSDMHEETRLRYI